MQLLVRTGAFDNLPGICSYPKDAIAFYYASFLEYPRSY